MRFAPKNDSMLTVSGKSDARFSLTRYPVKLKALSAGTEVAGMARYFLANEARHG